MCRPHILGSVGNPGVGTGLDRPTGLAKMRAFGAHTARQKDVRVYRTRSEFWLTSKK